MFVALIAQLLPRANTAGKTGTLLALLAYRGNVVGWLAVPVQMIQDPVGVPPQRFRHCQNKQQWLVMARPQLPMWFHLIPSQVVDLLTPAISGRNTHEQR